MTCESPNNAWYRPFKSSSHYLSMWAERAHPGIEVNQNQTEIVHSILNNLVYLEKKWFQTQQKTLVFKFELDVWYSKKESNTYTQSIKKKSNQALPHQLKHLLMNLGCDSGWSPWKQQMKNVPEISFKRKREQTSAMLSTTAELD